MKYAFTSKYPVFFFIWEEIAFLPLFCDFLQRENFANTQTRSLNYADGHPASRISGYCFQNPARYLITGRIIRPFISGIRLDSQNCWQIFGWPVVHVKKI